MVSLNPKEGMEPVSETHSSRGVRFYLLAGALTAIPLLVTWFVIQFVFTVLSNIGLPGVYAFSRLLNRVFPALSDWVTLEWLQALIAAFLTLMILYMLGRTATHVIGSKLIRAVDTLIEQIPVAKTIYGNTKKMLAVLHKTPGEKFERVVLVDFPNPPMKAIGFMTAQMTDEKSGEKMAAVFIPTTPNPTSGYLEIIPFKNVLITDWSIEDAMQYIISGGAAFSDKMPLAFLEKGAKS